MVSSRRLASATLALATVVVAQDFNTWTPPGPDDVRGPCPMLNTLANHGFLPHSGKDMDHDTVFNGLSAALNVDLPLVDNLFERAVETNLVTPNASTFSLSDLNNHGILEHDGSLSRLDFFFGDQQPFNQRVFDETRSYWTSESITVKMAADARLGRLMTSLRTNPDFILSTRASGFDVGETGALFLIFGDAKAGTASRSLIESFFVNERLPIDLGWSRSADPITDDMLEDLQIRLRESSYGNITAPNPAAQAADVDKRAINRMPMH